MMRVLLMALLLVTHASMAAESLGRLFTTPLERSNLEKLRQSQRGQLLEQASQPEAADNMPAPVPLPPSDLSVQGYVKRSDGGKGTVWINHQPLQEGSNNGQVQVGTVNQQGVPLTVHENGQHVRLKAGQVFNPETGQIIERNVHTTPGVPTSPAEQGVIR